MRHELLLEEWYSQTFFPSYMEGLSSNLDSPYARIVEIAEEDLYRFFAGQLMHKMGEKNTKIADLELKEFPLFDKTIVQYRCPLEYLYYSKHPGSSGIYFHDYEHVNDSILIRVIPGLTSHLNLYCTLLHEAIHNFTHKNNHYFGLSRINSKSEQHQKESHLLNEAVTEYVTRSIIESNFDRRGELLGRPPNMADVAATRRPYHEEIEALLQALSKLKGIGISDFIAAMLNSRQARPMTVLQERIKNAGGGSYQAFCKDIALEKAGKLLMRLFLPNASKR